jgi:hypothetical protein
VKRSKTEIQKNPGLNGGFYCELCKNDALRQPTCKEVRPNTATEKIEGFPTYRCTAARGHKGRHYACGASEEREEHYIISWRSKTRDVVWRKPERNSENESTSI